MCSPAESTWPTRSPLINRNWSAFAMSKNPFGIFDAVFGSTPATDSPVSPSPADASEPPRIVAGEAHGEQARNLNLAQDRHGEILAQPITPEMDPKEKRIIAEVATATIKAGISIDKTALKAHEDDSAIKRILGRLRESEERLRREEVGRLEEARPDGRPPFETDTSSDDLR
jgi:hypothetical protein